MSSDSSDLLEPRDRGDDDGRDDSANVIKAFSDRDDKELLKKQPWFWPYTTRDEVERRLAGKPDGTFLIRDCTVPGDFTLTVREAGGNRCVRIYRHATGYSLSPTEPDVPFLSLKDLVEFYHHRSLATFNKRLDVCLSHPLVKPASPGSNQYGVFKELYDLSQDQLSAQTRLSVLQHQRGELNRRVQLLEWTLPALRVVQQMYYESMQLQTDWTPRPPASSDGASDGAEPLHGQEETERLRADGSADRVDTDQGDRKVYTLSKDEEKSFTVNARLLLSRHSAMSDKLHSLKSHYDTESMKLQDLDADLKQLELNMLHLKRRQEELIRQMVEMGCQKEYLDKVLECQVATREFDRSTWLRDCSRDEALAQLEGLPHGAFLVRHKDKRHLPFVLSIVISVENRPRTVQHCYIVRPHGRGYGLNAALAVFQSIDQLVLRHRHVSLKHYFKELDVMLTFPVGCQELLHRSQSESDKESVIVKEGAYANAAAIQESMEDHVYEPVEFQEGSEVSSESRDPMMESKLKSGDLFPGRDCSGGQEAVEESLKKYESVESSSKLNASSKTAVLATAVKEHKYEYVDMSSKPAAPSAVVKEHKYEPVGAPDTSAHVGSTKSQQEKTMLELPNTGVDTSSSSHSSESVRNSKYETVFAGSTVETVVSVKNDGQEREEHVYEPVGKSARQTTV